MTSQRAKYTRNQALTRVHLLQRRLGRATTRELLAEAVRELEDARADLARAEAAVALMEQATRAGMH